MPVALDGRALLACAAVGPLIQQQRRTELPPLHVLADLSTRTLIEPAKFARLLDRMSHEERRSAVMACNGPHVHRAIWRAVAGAPRISIDDMVPPDVPPMRPVIFHLKNSLAMFSESQKRFVRAPDRHELWGYNHQPFAWFTGPGYYVARDSSHALGGVELDYRVLPPSHPEGWPRIKRNDRGGSILVYGGMVDYMRRVSRHVFIGAAVRGGAFADMYFILCREL